MKTPLPRPALPADLINSRVIGLLLLAVLFVALGVHGGDSAFPDNDKMEIPAPPKGPSREISIFNGKDFTGFAGDGKWWSIENGEIVAKAPNGIGHNTFLQSKQRLGDFRLILQIKLANDAGNSGIQFRSEALKGFEAKGYQADAGPGWWGKIYEEHGRGLIAAEGAPEGVVKKGDWNLYEILCVGSHIRTAINGVLCSELNDAPGAKEGVICIQLHSGPATEIRVKDIRVEANPEDSLKTVTVQRSKPGELTPDEERATFKLPEGFSAELVCSEPHAPKVVDIAFDDAGRMWALTAMEYPLDGNEQPKAAAELFAKGGKDKILVFDAPHKPGPHVPRVFAENLAMPMAVLPYKNGALVGHGSEILFLEDTNGDGKADKRTVVLSGFGIQDSHLFPHRFIRGPGDWVYFAQGAFNYSDVKTKEGTTVQFHQCKLGRFKLDGARFEIAGVGMNNIWGMVIGATGEMFIQEANDCGYPVVPFYVGGTYAGGGMHKFKPYSPWQTPLADGFQMGGTGLSGLALSEDTNGFPPPYDKTMFLANPITNKIQQVKISADGPGYKLEKLPEFLETSDKSFRPVAMYFGPDGCLYIVDWYNKVISHNEVPRNHPERDKLRSRVWRIRHASMKPFDVPDLTKAADAELLKTLRGGNVRLAQAAQRQIADRAVKSLAPELKKLALDTAAPVSPRVFALWSLESLVELDAGTLQVLIADKDRNVRREAIRAAADSTLPAAEILKLIDALANDTDPQVRAETLRTLGSIKDVDAVVSRLVKWARGPLFGRTVRTPQGGALCNTGEAADRDFERFMWRLALEPRLSRMAELAKSADAAQWPTETKALVGLALGNKEGIALFTQTMPALQRELSTDEIGFLMQHTGDPAAAAAVGSALKNPETAPSMLRQLLQVKDKVNTSALNADIATAAKSMLSRKAGTPEINLVLQLASAFKIKELEPEILKVLGESKSKETTLASLRALAALGSNDVELLSKTVRAAKPGDEVYNESVAALAASTNEAAIPFILELWPMLPANTRRLAVDRLTAKAGTARSLMKAIKSGEIKREEIDGYTLGKLQAILADDPELADLNKKLAARMKKSLRLTGSNGFAGDAISLKGTFTVETWVKLEPNIGNADAILGAPGKASFNFYDGKFRVWWGTDGDTVVARKPTEPEQWQHIAVTRNKEGVFKIYLNGELDATGSKPFPRDMDGLFIGRSTVDPGTQGRLAEFRVWNVERTADEIREWSTLAADVNAKPAGLVQVQGSTSAWTPVSGKAAVESSLDFPPLLSAEEATELRGKFETNRQLAAKGGDLARGKTAFMKTCAVCHKARGEGSDIGPPLDGAGASGTESLLRNILQPSAAVESGFRQYRVETTDRQIVEGLLFSQNDNEIVLRRPGQENARVERSKVKRAGYSQMSIMPEGLLDGLTPQEVSDLFAYLLTLK